MTKFYIGTASWTDPGFIEDWYPKGLPKSQLLRWYAEHFNYVEVNATFYALPAAKTVERWATETPDDFLFDVKLPKVLSRHRMEAKFLPADLRAEVGSAARAGRTPQRGVPAKSDPIPLTPENERLIVRRLLRELKPLFEAKKFGAFLLQMSPAFSPRNGHGLAELDSIRDLLAPHPLAVELRNRDWVSGRAQAPSSLREESGRSPDEVGRIAALSALGRGAGGEVHPAPREVPDPLQATLEYFKSRRIAFVMVDAPESEHFTVMPSAMNEVTNPKLAYLRLHGRNAEGYIKGRSVPERFNHEYTVAELQEIKQRVEKVVEEHKPEEIHVVANNNNLGYAPRTAEWIQEALHVRLERELKRKQAELPLPK